MRSKSCCMALSVLLFLSCHLRQQGVPTDSPGISDSLAVKIPGVYHGHFSKGMLTLVINYISGGIVSGYDLHEGTRRNVNGEVGQKGQQLNFVLKEPGNNPVDGTFFISLDTISLAMTGQWVPVDSSRVHAGPLDLIRWVRDTTDNYISGQWYGDPGSLHFNDDGSCQLSYSKGDGTSGITIWGNYEQKAKTVSIEWEPNDHLRTRKMKLIMSRGAETAPTLQGDGAKFIENTAG